MFNWTGTDVAGFVAAKYRRQRDLAADLDTDVATVNKWIKGTHAVSNGHKEKLSRLAAKHKYNPED